jgi:hypothetical protein
MKLVQDLSYSKLRNDEKWVLNLAFADPPLLFLKKDIY